MTGEKTDFAAADKAAGITKEYREVRGLTWHHHENGNTMQLIPSDLNGNTPHTGSAAVARSARQQAEEQGIKVSDIIALLNPLSNTTDALKNGGDVKEGLKKDATVALIPPQVMIP